MLPVATGSAILAAATLGLVWRFVGSRGTTMVNGRSGTMSPGKLAAPRHGRVPEPDGTWLVA